MAVFGASSTRPAPPVVGRDGDGRRGEGRSEELHERLAVERAVEREGLVPHVACQRAERRLVRAPRRLLEQVFERDPASRAPRAALVHRDRPGWTEQAERAERRRLEAVRVALDQAGDEHLRLGARGREKRLRGALVEDVGGGDNDELRPP
jgi:hypothetical protein